MATNYSFPSLRAKMGDLAYYVTLMSFGDVARWIKRANDIHEKQELKTWIQREITEKRLESLASYLVNQKQRFFNAIVVGIYGGDPDWFPVTVHDSPVTSFELNDLTRLSFGILKLEGEEEIFAIDGQHRVEGIKAALNKNAKLKSEQQCVIFVAHDTTDEGRVRTRRLFTTLNKYARPVSEGEIVALDEDDVFAIVTRKIIDDYRPLKNLILFTRTPNLPANDETSITTTVALYQLIQLLALPIGSRDRSRLKIGPPKKSDIDRIYGEHCRFWDLLIKHVPELNKVTKAKKKKTLAGHYRKEGGHLLFRPVGQHAFGSAIRVMLDSGHNLEDAVKSLSRMNMYLTSEPWRKVLWNPSTKNILSKYKKLAQNLFLYMANEKLSSSNYDLLKTYRSVIDDETALLPPAFE